MLLKKLFCNHDFIKECIDLENDYYFDCFGYPQLDKIAVIKEICNICNKSHVYKVKVRESSSMEKIVVAIFYKQYKDYC